MGSSSAPGGLVPALIGAVIICLLFGPAHAGDAEALLEFASLAGARDLAGWNVSNIANLCVNWEGIDCTPGGRVQNITLISPEGLFLPPRFNGTFSSALLNLTELENLDLSRATQLAGTVPPSLFQLPKITRISLSNMPAYIRLPAQLSPSLIYITIDDSDFEGVVPELDWVAMTGIDLSGTRLSCPLPQSFVTHLENRLPIQECQFRNTRLFIDKQNRLCGRSFLFWAAQTSPINLFLIPMIYAEIDVDKVPCNIVPLASEIPPIPAQPQFRDRASNLSIILDHNLLYLFATYPLRNGSRVDYKQEYFALQIFPTRLNLPNSKRLTFRTSGFQSFVWNADRTILKANATMVSPTLNYSTLIQEFVLNTASPPRYLEDADIAKFKFSINVYNVNTTWPTFSEPRAVVASLSAVYRAPHSPATGPPIVCTGVVIAQSCTSSVTELDFRPGNNQTYETEFKVKNKIELKYSFDSTGKLDGVPLTGSNIDLSVFAALNPIGSLDVLKAINKFYPAGSRVAGPEENQSLQILTEVIYAPFNRLVEYDPDVSLRLLFNPETGEPPLTEAEVAGLSAGVIAAIVIVVVVAIAAVVLFPTVVFPYMKKRQEAAEAEKSAEINLAEKEPSTSGRWTTAEPKSRGTS